MLLLWALGSPLHYQAAVYGWPQAASQMLLHLVVSIALVYAGHQKLAGSEIALKAYPAALVSYLLWSCMMLRWMSS